MGNNPLGAADADGHYSNGSNGQPCGDYGSVNDAGGEISGGPISANVPCSAPDNNSYSADKGEGQQWANDTAEAAINGLASQDQMDLNILSVGNDNGRYSSHVVTGASANQQRSLVLGMLGRLLVNTETCKVVKIDIQ